MLTAEAAAKPACATHRHGDRAKQRLPWGLTLLLEGTSQSPRQKRPTFSKKSPTFFGKSPTFLEKSPTFFGKTPTFFLNAPSSLCTSGRGRATKGFRLPSTTQSQRAALARFRRKVPFPQRKHRADERFAQKGVPLGDSGFRAQCPAPRPTYAAHADDWRCERAAVHLSPKARPAKPHAAQRGEHRHSIAPSEDTPHR